MNVGRTYKTLEKYEESEAAYLRAKDLFPPVIPGQYQGGIVSITQACIYTSNPRGGRPF